jgi:two-component system KDP operon response regulator KdpE
MAKPTITILVIDDEPQIRRFVSAGLELYGYLVREAENGSAALRLAVQRHILVDTLVPGIRVE